MGAGFVLGGALGGLAELARERADLVLDRRQARVDAAAGERPVEAVDGVLDPLKALGDRAQPAREPFDVGGGRDVERTHRELLRLRGALARVERGADDAGQDGVLLRAGR